MKLEQHSTVGFYKTDCKNPQQLVRVSFFFQIFSFHTKRTRERIQYPII